MGAQAWRAAGTAALMLVMVLLGGCRSPALVGAPEPLMTADELEASLKPYLGPDVVTTYQGKSGADQTNYRDQVIYARIAVIDARFKAFLTGLGVESKSFGIGADAAVIGLNTGSVLSGGETAKNILSGLAGAVTGIKGSVDKNAFYDQTVPTLVSQMVASRREVLAGMLGKMQTANYTLVEALIDLEGYEFAGSFAGALQQIGQKAGNQLQVAEARLQQLATTRLQASDVAPDQIQARAALAGRIQGLTGPQAIAAVKQAATLPAFSATVQQAQQAGADPASETGARALLKLLLSDAFASTGTLAQLTGIINGVSAP
ncbi:hypothetical protein [Oleisolibacter albus]|uniref:hypothetical protein n=1 Tax=Oleisolibacter albus TaxID=2171757 RepID=UPI0012D7BB26|nr:hypothetical protein [Oleisolibacter albus]